MANIVACADGTWNRPEEDAGDQPSNVLKLARGVSPGDAGFRQHTFYDWGLGSYHDSKSAGMTGRGIRNNILDGYRYIVHNYAPGDRIFLFGYSRGAYTVRALCGLIYNCTTRDRASCLAFATWRREHHADLPRHSTTPTPSRRAWADTATPGTRATRRWTTSATSAPFGPDRNRRPAPPDIRKSVGAPSRALRTDRC